MRAGIFRRHETPSGDKDCELVSRPASLSSFSSPTSTSGAERKAEERFVDWTCSVLGCLSRSSKSSSAMTPSSSGGESGTTCSMPVIDQYQEEAATANLVNKPVQWRRVKRGSLKR